MANVSMTNYTRDKVLNAILRNTTYTAVATVYLGLYSSATTAAGGGTEASGGSYARQSVAFSAPSPNGVTTNSGTITFTMPAGTWAWWAIKDASTSGNMLLYGPMDAQITTTAGNTVSFAPGKINWVVT